MKQVPLSEIAARVGGTVHGDPARTVAGVLPPEQARPIALCVVWQTRLAQKLAPDVPLLAPAEAFGPGREGVEVADPRAALPDLLALFAPPKRFAPGVHPSAVVDPTATISPAATVGPLCVVGPGARLADGAVLEAQVHVGADVVVGERSRIEPHVVLCEGTTIGAGVLIHGGTVIGADGFGFIPDGHGGHRKIPQVGRVVIEDDVEIGAKCTVDRATLGETRIGRGTKLDDQVHVGHNCHIGANCLLVAFTGVAGSATLEDGVVLAAQAGVNPHVTVGKGTIVAGRGGVTSSVGAGLVVSGFPAQEHKAELRQQALIRRLPELFDRLKKLETP